MSFETSDRAFKMFADAYGKAWSAPSRSEAVTADDRPVRTTDDRVSVSAAPSPTAEAQRARTKVARRLEPTRPL